MFCSLQASTKGKSEREIALDRVRTYMDNLTLPSHFKRDYWQGSVGLTNTADRRFRFKIDIDNNMFLDLVVEGEIKSSKIKYKSWKELEIQCNWVLGSFLFLGWPKDEAKLYTGVQ